MVSHGKPPKTNQYNAWNPGAKETAERRGRKHTGLMTGKTKKAIAELAAVESLDDFKRICEEQASKRERDGY